MTVSTVNGYLVVRIQHDYRGIDRAPFEAVADAYFQKALPPAILEAYARARVGCEYWTPICLSRADGEALLDYTNEKFARADGVELIGVSSRYLSSHGVQSHVEPKMRCVGFDVVRVGEWSLLGALIYAGLAKVKLGTHLNEYGLLDDPDRAEFVQRIHEEAVRDRKVEELSKDPRLPVDVVGIFVDAPRPDPG